MAQPVITRSQRRLESKQYGAIIVLILAVAGVSFYLGVQFGKKGGDVVFSDDAVKPKLPIVTQVKPPPQPVEDNQEQTEKLTFYDNLPKGKQAPLGSGINLPPEKEQPVQQSTPAPKQAVPVASLPAKPLPKVSAAPPPAKDGAFVVQVASFRTKEDAGKLAERLKAYHLSTFIEQADLGEKGVWYRVLSGPFATRNNADAAAGLLREKERLSALVRQR